MTNKEVKKEKILLPNSNINIFLPENIKKQSNILIFGNTCNFFGNKIIYNNDNEFERLKRFIKAIKNKCNFYIICTNEKTYEYYKMLFTQIRDYFNIKNITTQIKLESLYYDSDSAEKKYKNIYYQKVIKKIKDFHIMKFDILLANPPFSLGDKMLIKWFDIANEICTIQPSTWLLGKKQNKKITDNVDKCSIAEIESIQGSEHFDASISGVLAIQHFIKETDIISQNNQYDKQIIFDNKKYNKCEDIKSYSNDTLLEEFVKIITPLLQDNLQNHIKYIPGRSKDAHLLSCKLYDEYNPDDNWLCLYMPLFGGKEYYIYNKNTTINDVYKYKDLLNTNYKVYFAFNDINTVNNFINYIKTYFCRVCLYLLKNNLHLDRGELKYIPWFDFSEPIFSKSPSEIDDYLFKKYNISDEIRKHIEEILPDYYSIRKGRD